MTVRVGASAIGIDDRARENKTGRLTLNVLRSDISPCMGPHNCGRSAGKDVSIYGVRDWVIVACFGEGGARTVRQDASSSL